MNSTVIFYRSSMSYIDLRKPAKEAFQGDEDVFQKNCAEFAKKELLRCGIEQEVFFHVPSEGVRKPQYRAKLKLMGFRAGIADCIFMVPADGYHGLVIELKTRGNGPSDDQKKWLGVMAERGYLALVVNDFETFRNCLTKYLELV